MSNEITVVGGADAVPRSGRQHAGRRYRETFWDLPVSKTICMRGHTVLETGRPPALLEQGSSEGRIGEP